MKAGIWMVVVLMGALAGEVAAGESNSSLTPLTPALAPLTSRLTPNLTATLVVEPAKFDAVYSICTNVVPIGNSDFSGANGINLIGAPAAYFQAHSMDLDLNETLKITLIEGPKHGEIRNDNFYFPNVNYLGPDQMTFLVEVKGKIFKVIYTLYVDPNSEYVPPECGSGYNGYMIKELPNPARSMRRSMGHTRMIATTLPPPQPSPAGRGGNRERQS